MNLRRSTPFAVSVLAALAALVLLRPDAPPAKADPAPPAAPSAQVRVALATMEQMRSLVAVPGSVVSRNDAPISAEVAGALSRVAEVGERVARGDVIARIDDAAVSLRVREADADVRRLEARGRYLAQQEARLTRLSGEGIVAANDLEDISSQRQANDEELAQARASRDRLAHERELTWIRAPFAGQVAERLQQPGGYVGVGTPVVRLVDTGRVEVQARAPLAAAPWLRDGMEVAVLAGETPLAGRVRTVVTVGDARSRMIEVRVSLPPGAGVIGSAVRVELPQSESQSTVAVPRDALVLRQEGTFVFKLGAENTAERVRVETGIGHGALIGVSGDVAAGDRVVVRGAERLRSGQAVSVEAS